MKIDLKFLTKVFSTFGVLPLNNIQGAVETITAKRGVQDEGEINEILTEAGYSFSPNTNSYQLTTQFADDEQEIRVLTQGVMLWSWQNKIGRILTLDTLRKWVLGDSKYPMGKANKFMELYNQHTNAGPKTPVDRMAGNEEIPYEPVSGPVPDRSGVAPSMSEADKVLSAAVKKAGKNKKLPSDDIIDLYHKAEEIKKSDPTGAKKIMDFIKGLTIQKENYINESYLEDVIREVVRECLKEEAPLLNMNKTLNDIPEKDRRKVSLQTLQNPEWESPISREEAAAFLKRIGYSDAQIEDLASKDIYLDEETGTAAVSPVSTPFAFRKKELREGEEAEYQSSAWDGSDDELRQYGLDYYRSPKKKKATPAKKKVKTPSSSKAGKITVKGKEIKLDESLSQLKEMIRKIVKEMTTTGAVTGYNVPGAFSGNKMKSKDHIEVLGYKLTPAGEKEYHRKGDKLL